MLGWFSRLQEREHHGRWFWLRPFLIELALTIALPVYYLMVTQRGLLLPEQEVVPLRLMLHQESLHLVFVAHALLLVLMTAATFIDFDEQTIPDIITVPGTLFALSFATLNPKMFMPVLILGGNGGLAIGPVTFSLPSFPAGPEWSQGTGAITALAIWTVWCFALTNRRVILRKGLAKAVQFFFAGLVRYPTWKIIFGMWCFGIPAILGVWWLGGQAWTGLLTGLVGLAVGGGILWAVRIVASTAMGVEAMGFGDVTLMAMIGAFIGWQASLAAFFLSPIAAIAIVLIQYIITRESRVPFGPYLCAGTVLTAIFWDAIYNGYLSPTLGALAPVLLWFAVAMFGLLGGMLFVWSLVKRALLSP